MWILQRTHWARPIPRQLRSSRAPLSLSGLPVLPGRLDVVVARGAEAQPVKLGEAGKLRLLCLAVVEAAKDAPQRQLNLRDQHLWLQARQARRSSHWLMLAVTATDSSLAGSGVQIHQWGAAAHASPAEGRMHTQCGCGHAHPNLPTSPHLHPILPHLQPLFRLQW